MKMIILDRDGVINFDSAQFIKSPDEWQPIPGSLQAIARLTRAGYVVVVATNQSGIERGLFDMDMLNVIHAKMHQAVTALGGAIEAIFYCPHTDNSTCECRKPKPGMLRRIAECYNQDLAQVPAVGDSLRDLQAASAAGALPYLVLTGKGEETQAAGNLPPNTQVFADLAAVVNSLLGETAKS